jgi:signal transduction histidine kinase
VEATAHIAVTFRPARAVEREIWQIALEAITNVERHAHAQRMSVEYQTHDRHVLLRVSDDGVGLNTAVPATDRYGMVGMRERAERIGATLRSESPSSGGTTITLELVADEPTG